MFSKIAKTAYPPSKTAMMVWDGKCGFCKFWITNWQSKTNKKLIYKTYQEVSELYPDIPLKEFKKASRLIETNGEIFSGPNSAYRSFLYFEKPNYKWHRWYSNYKWFQLLSDKAYNFIAKHRGFMFNITKIFFGKNPCALKPYWFLILIFGFSIIYLLTTYL
ncbi:DUF393 domain-containing protein [Aequorivita sp. F47161]|uniref:DUF393 domain-containing protein n=1 Tax=Aequorivita vitellina TaxID=2874475 RepID=A0A9X1QW89_9FLAO|nr:DUF393 domain-containing protein [Aequorivita vitellina]MCG2418542.1 DUF393 domain-containing protein [Aequorivita vitellina]MCZ4319313.1 DUF393 domain-containing protein [Aequorivita viscosa]